MNLEKLEKYRIKSGMGASSPGDRYGMFFIPSKPGKPPLKIIAAPFDNPTAGWEHVSASVGNRMPTWNEMCMVKDLFWSKDQTVVQFHPPESEYVNNHRFCLHLWRNVNQEPELPPSILVGVKDMGELLK